jgi:hypothetical protein
MSSNKTEEAIIESLKKGEPISEKDVKMLCSIAKDILK